MRDQSDYAKAREFYVESLTINYEFGDRRAIAYVLEDMAALAAVQNEASRALQLVGAAQTLRKEIGTPLSAVEKSQLDGRLTAVIPVKSLPLTKSRLTAVLNYEEANTYLEQGQQRSLADAIDFALGK